MTLIEEIDPKNKSTEKPSLVSLVLACTCKVERSDFGNQILI
jgi:hypothetical protein